MSCSLPPTVSNVGDATAQSAGPAPPAEGNDGLQEPDTKDRRGEDDRCRKRCDEERREREGDDDGDDEGKKEKD